MTVFLDDLTLAEKLELYRQHHGYTQAELACKFSVSQSFVSKLVNGKLLRRYRKMKQFERALDATLRKEIYSELE